MNEENQGVASDEARAAGLRPQPATQSSQSSIANAWTPGPWDVGEYSPTLGYDCMTGGIRVGPLVLDAGDYGQGRCEYDSPPPATMLADAHLIAAAPEMASAIQKLVFAWDSRNTIAEQIVTGKTDATPQMRALEAIEDMRALLAKITPISDTPNA